MMLLLLGYEMVSLGFDTPENVERYAHILDSIKNHLEGGEVVVLGDGDSLFIGGKFVGVAPRSLRPDTLPITLSVKPPHGESMDFYLDFDSSQVVVIYATPPKGWKASLPPYETTDDAYIFNVNGKRVAVIRSIQRKGSFVKVYGDTFNIRQFWPLIDSLVKHAQGKTLIFVGAYSVKVDDRSYPRDHILVIRNVPPGIHRIRAKGLLSQVKAHVDVSKADVLIFLMEPYVEGSGVGTDFDFKYDEETLMRFAGGCAGGSLGAMAGLCVGGVVGRPMLGCLVGGFLGTLLGLNLSCSL